MVSNCFLLPSASLLLTKMDYPSTLPLSQIWSNLPCGKRVKIPQKFKHLQPEDTSLWQGFTEASPVWGFKTFTAQQMLFAGRTSCNPYAHCTVGPAGGQSGGSGPELMTAGGWRNIGWVRPAENPAQRFRGRYSLCGWPGRRLCSSSSSPDT